MPCHGGSGGRSSRMVGGRTWKDQGRGEKVGSNESVGAGQGLVNESVGANQGLVNIVHMHAQANERVRPHLLDLDTRAHTLCTSMTSETLTLRPLRP